MLDAPYTPTERRTRLGGSGVLRHSPARPAGIIRTDTTQQTVSILNSTRTDIHVVTELPVSIGQHVTMILNPSTRGSELSIAGVVHWTNNSDDGLEAGIALLDPLPQAAMVKAPGSQRNSIRYACRIDGRISWTDISPRSQSALVLNYSYDGMCLQAPYVAPVQTEIQFSWQSGNSEQHIDAVIHWVIGQGDGFLIGCEFHKDAGYLLSGVRI